MKKSKKSAVTIKVTEKMIEDWKVAIKREPTPRLFREITQAFKAAVATTKGEGGGQCRYKVADSAGRTPRLPLHVHSGCTMLMGKMTVVITA